ncbi:GspH/FimT family pseudopilin [Porticoccaceae bacterium]|nr:GspH/FimT family pseudopilin [Porticoccaceae bacterium]
MSRSATTEQLNCTSQAGKGNTWIVFDDKNDDGKRQPDEKISQQWQLRYTDQQLFASGRSGLRFSNSQRSIDSGSILLCHPKLIHGVRVILFQSGSIRLSEDANNNGREDRNGTSLLCGVD